MSAIFVSEAASRAANILQKSPIKELRALTIEETSGGLCIYGSLSSYYNKQLAQETLRGVCVDANLVLRNQTRVYS